MLKLTSVKAGLDYTLLEFLVRGLPGDNGMLSPSKFENAFKRTCVDEGRGIKSFVEDKGYLHSELRRRKDETDRLESSLVIDHGAALQLHNFERFREINFVPTR